jgi:hypothetical protein
MHTGQISDAPKNSLSQLGQVRWVCVFMGLTNRLGVLKLEENNRCPTWVPSASAENRPFLANCAL